MDSSGDSDYERRGRLKHSFAYEPSYSRDYMPYGHGSYVYGRTGDYPSRSAPYGHDSYVYGRTGDYPSSSARKRPESRLSLDSLDDYVRVRERQLQDTLATVDRNEGPWWKRSVPVRTTFSADPLSVRENGYFGSASPVFRGPSTPASALGGRRTPSISHEEIHKPGKENRRTKEFERGSALGNEDARPTWTRMALRHIDVRTLETYGIDFVYDQEPGYVLIKRWVPEWEQEVLWGHTRRLRQSEKHREEEIVREVEDRQPHRYPSSAPSAVYRHPFNDSASASRSLFRARTPSVVSAVDYVPDVYTVTSSGSESDSDTDKSGSQSREYREQTYLKSSRPDLKVSLPTEEHIKAEWRDPKRALPDGSVSEILAIHSAEFQVERTGKEKVVLACPSRPQVAAVTNKGSRSPVQMRWRHVQHPNPSLQILSQIVLDCPLISTEHRRAALATLEKALIADTRSGSLGTVVMQGDETQQTRADQSHTRQQPDTSERVLLTKTLHLDLLSDQGQRKTANKGTRTLLEFLYNDETQAERERKQVVRQMGIASSDQLLHVSTLWSLLLGDDLLITLSHRSRADVHGDLMDVDTRSDQGFFTVPVRYDPGIRHNIVIEPDCSYVDFLVQAVFLCTGAKERAGEYELQVEGEASTITASRWLNLLSSEAIEDTTLWLVPAGTSHTQYEPSYRHTSSKSLPFLRTAPHQSSSSYFSAASSPYYNPFYDVGYSSNPFAPSVPRRPPPLGANRISRSPQTTVRSNSPLSRERSFLPRESTDNWSSRGRKSRVKETVRYSIRTTTLFFYGTSPHERLLSYDVLSSDPATLGQSTGLSSSDGTLSKETGLRRRGPLFARFPMPSWQDESDGIRVYPLPDLAQNHSRSFVTHHAYVEDDDSNDSYRPHAAAGSRSEARVVYDSPIEVEYPINSRTRPSHRYSSDDSEDMSLSLDSGSPGTRRSHRRRQRRTTSFSDDGEMPPPLMRKSHDSSEVAEVEAVASHGKKVHFQRPKTSSRSATASTVEPPVHDLRTLGITTLPFFTWQLGVKSKSSIPESEQSDATLFRILNKINKLVRIDGSRKLYTVAHRCNKEDLIKRYSILIQQHRVPSKAQLADESVADDSIRQSIVASEASSPSTLKDKMKLSWGSMVPTLSKAPTTSWLGKDMVPKEPLPGDGHSMGSKGVSSPDSEPFVGPIYKEFDIMQQIIDQSQVLLEEFLPKDSSSQYHQVCARFWGALDGIIRQLVWSMSPKGSSQGWVVRDFDGAQLSTLNCSVEKSYQSCDSCQHQLVYSEAGQALEHIHAHHLSCSNAIDTRGWPSDDPCFSWLKQVSNLASSPEMLGMLKRFLAHLVEVSEMANEVHSVVATIKPALGSAPQRPLLPAHLVTAFEDLLTAYIVMSKCCTAFVKMEAHNGSPDHRLYVRRYRKFSDITAEAFEDALYVLQLAKKDVILASSDSDSTSTLGLHAVGPEFVVAALMAAAHDRPLQATKSDKTTLDVYTNYVNKLRYQANQRPKRRLFLDIHNLEEELRALRSLTRLQRKQLELYLDAITPRDEQWEDEQRADFYDFEKRYLDEQIGKLDNRIHHLSRLEERCAMLKAHVKQTLEILEEDHGKAIRVFTIVTLFFLPMTFVSGFMGMNTNDIRNMDNNQELFWSVAVPVTVLVLSLAFFYAYKGDDIEDWMSAMMHPQRLGSVAPKKRELHSTSLGLDGFTEKDVPRSRWKFLGVKNLVTRKNSAIVRRRTDDSWVSRDEESAR